MIHETTPAFYYSSPNRTQRTMNSPTTREFLQKLPKIFRFS
jgi:hypothetical protein